MLFVLWTAVGTLLGRSLCAALLIVREMWALCALECWYAVQTLACWRAGLLLERRTPASLSNSGKLARIVPPSTPARGTSLDSMVQHKEQRAKIHKYYFSSLEPISYTFRSSVTNMSPHHP